MIIEWRKNTTLAKITDDVKKIKVEKPAMEVSLKIGRTIKWTEIMDVLVDEFTKDIQEVLIHRETKEKVK